jgi:hypothetical protein
MHMRLQRIQQQLGATDDEFAVLSPKIQQIFTLQTDAGGGRGRGGFGGGPGGPPGGPRGFGGPGGTGGPGGQQPSGPQSAVQLARQELQQAIDDENGSADVIKIKLAAYRDAVAKAKTDLAAAQKNLQALLTQRQEAALVLSNLLD